MTVSAGREVGCGRVLGVGRKGVSFAVTVIGVRAALAKGRGVGSGENPDSQVTLIFLSRASHLTMEACTLPSSRAFVVGKCSSGAATRPEPGSLGRFRVMTWSCAELEALPKPAVSYLFPKKQQSRVMLALWARKQIYSANSLRRLARSWVR